jgi:diadenosine tetraphosphate (Ap4A) HIT family hydrolase
MTEGGCAFCTVIAALEHSETCPARAAGHVLRKVRDLPASIAILAPDQYYRGYTMVVSKTHATELYDLPRHASTQYFNDMLAVARAIAAAFHPRKMNYEVLGNTVAHLHWHLFPRYDWDPNPKGPIWETSHTPRVASPEEYADTLAAIRRHLEQPS